MVALSGVSGVGVYSTTLPMKLLHEFDAGWSFERTLACFDIDGTHLYVYYSAKNRIIRYLTSTMQPVDTLRVATDFLLKREVLAGTLQYNPIDTSIHCFVEQLSVGKMLRARIKLGQTEATVSLLDSLYSNYDVGSTQFLCDLNFDFTTLLVRERPSGHIVDSLIPTCFVSCAAANERYVVYTNIKDTLVVWDRKLRSIHMLYVGALSPYNVRESFNLPPLRLGFIGSNILIFSFANTVLFQLEAKSTITTLPFGCASWMPLLGQKRLLLLPLNTFFSYCDVGEMPVPLSDLLQAAYTQIHFDGTILDDNADDRLVPMPEAVEYSWNGEIIAVQQSNYLTKIANTSNGSVRCHIEATGVLSADAEVLYSATTDTIVAYSTLDAQRLFSFGILPHVAQPVLIASSDGSMICAYSATQAEIYSTKGVRLQSLQLPQGFRCSSLHFCDKDRALALLGERSELYRYTISSDAWSSNLLNRDTASSFRPSHACFSRDGSTLALNTYSALSGGTLCSVYRTTNGSLVYQVAAQPMQSICSQVLSHDGRFLFLDIHNDDHIIRSTDFDVHDCRAAILRSHTNTHSTSAGSSTIAISCMHRALSPDESSMVVWQDCTSPIRCVEQTIVGVEDEEAIASNNSHCYVYRGVLHLPSDCGVLLGITIHNMLGHVLYSAQGSAAQQSTIDVSCMAVGAYVVRSTYDNGHIKSEVVVIY